jgi:broad specificity phosphatase PhoE
MPRLYLVRHGAVSPDQRFYGQLDLPLSEVGREQMRKVTDVLAPLKAAAIHCSDLLRAKESAQIIAAPHGLEPIPDAAFREMHLGVLEGLSHEEALERYPDLASKRYQDMWRFRFPDGENLEDVAARARPALASLLAAHPSDEEVLILVAHNSVNRVLLGDELGLPLSRVFRFAQDFGCVNRIDYKKDRARVSLLNWTPTAFT